MKLLAAVLIGLVIVMGSAETKTASAATMFQKQVTAITYVFCKDYEKHVDISHPCEYGREALVVASLEGGKFHWYRGTCNNAVNGQYLGCFQMGASERRIYGHGSGVWAQARAAYKYWKRSGRDWSPWSCKPQGYCLN